MSSFIPCQLRPPSSSWVESKSVKARSRTLQSLDLISGSKLINQNSSSTNEVSTKRTSSLMYVWETRKCLIVNPLAGTSSSPWPFILVSRTQVSAMHPKLPLPLATPTTKPYDNTLSQLDESFIRLPTSLSWSTRYF